LIAPTLWLAEAANVLWRHARLGKITAGEAFELFAAMLESVKLEVIKTLTAVEVRTQEDIRADDQMHVENITPVHAGSAGADAEADEALYGNGDVALAEAATKKKVQPTVRHTQKVGRNDPCPCGSGKKYKKCHGAPVGVNA